MRLEIESLWSPDLDPPGQGVPEDCSDFEVLVQAEIAEVGKPGSEVFSLVVASPSALSRTESGRFVADTLVLNQFDWAAISSRIHKLLLHCDSCESWEAAVQTVGGFLRHNESE